MNPNSGTELSVSLTTGFFTAHVLEWLKTQRWFPFMQFDFSALNRTFAWIVAIAMTVGIHTTFFTDATGWHLTFSGTHTSVFDFLVDICRQYAGQKISYETTVRKQQE